jgi:hypothetical protein
LSGEEQESTTVEDWEGRTPSLEITTALTLLSNKLNMLATPSQLTLLDDIHSVKDSV